MTTTAATLDLALEMNRADALRFLGYPAQPARPTRATSRLDELWPEASALLAPRGAFRVVGSDEAKRVGMPDPGRSVALAVCSIGAALEQESARRSHAGALLDALLLDAIGSVAAEAASDALESALRPIAAAHGLVGAPRISPGYGDWETGCQRSLLALLPIGELGIELTEGAMMVPRKSVSFAVSFEPESRLVGHTETQCARCRLYTCRYRRGPAPRR